MLTSLIIALLFLAGSTTCRQPTYQSMKGHQVVSFTIDNEEQLEMLRALEETNQIDVWTRDSNLGIGPNDVRIPSDSVALDKLRSMGITPHVVVQDVNTLLEKEMASFTRNISFDDSKNDWFTEYHRYEEIVQRLQFLEAKYPTWVTFVPSIGPTFEGEGIRALKISTGGTGKNNFLSNGCIHAREWISPATIMFIIETFLEKLAENDPEAISILDKVNLLFVPVLNVDGYKYTWDTNRMWRKSRNINVGSTARGVDLNRNFDNNWGGPGSSPNPSSDTYRGASAASEPETNALVNFYNDNQPVSMTIDWHSYSQYILRPWAWTRTPSDCEEKCASVSNEMAAVIRAESGKVYSAGIWYTLLYPSSGTVQDYCYAESTSPSSDAVGYTVELRPTSSNPGFVLPASEIIPTGEENYEGFIVAAKAAA